MRIVYQRCCGMDVHQQSVTACLNLIDQDGEFITERRRFGTMTKSLREMAAWLNANGVERIAMEATGVYWKPVWNILEGTHQFDLLLANPQHIKNVPGRKTDQKDSEWIADLLQHGLLQSSFVPPLEIRRLRDLTRMRASLRQDHARVANRIQKILEDANIKLGSVASDVLGVSGRLMLKSMLGGKQDPQQLAQLARGRLREKMEALQLALEGNFTDHHRFQLRQLLEGLEFIEGQVGKVHTETARLIARVPDKPVPLLVDPPQTPAEPASAASPLQTAVDLLKTIPGVDDVAAAILVAEIGVNMNQFSTPGHLASWAGLCPGNNESAGKRLSGTTRNGSVWLRRALCQAAWAASRTRKTYLSALYRRLIVRKGKKKTIVAVAHTILVIAYHIIKNQQPYQELGADYFDRLDQKALERRLVRRLTNLGYQVTLTQTSTQASG
jgi:transposase